MDQVASLNAATLSDMPHQEALYRMELGPNTPRLPDNVDAVFGLGLYGTELGPNTPRPVVCANNFFDMLKSADISELLLQEAIDKGCNLLPHKLRQLGTQIRRKRPDLWEKTEVCIYVSCPNAYRAVLPPENGGE